VEPRADPRARPRARPRWSSRPATEIELLPRPGPVTSAPGSHRQKPPKGPGKKERKLKTKTANAFNLIRRVFEGAFESIEVIEAIYLALPKNVRDFYPDITRRDPAGMIWLINKHFQTIDLQEMVENILWNEVEDYIYGGLGRISQHVAQNLDLSTGPQFGGGARRAEVAAWRRRQARDAIEFIASQTETFK